MRSIKQALIWLKRFRHRRGYGVHSPFAFNFITGVIYENTSYYDYYEIENRIRDRKTKANAKQLRGVNRLLFRLVNSGQPATIIDAGRPSVASEYMRAAKKAARYVGVTPDDLTGISDAPAADFLYIHCPEEPAFVEKMFRYGLEHVGCRSMIVVGGIYESAAMKALWRQFIADDRVGVTFDLYDVGIMFFDRKKIKQHYTVNF